MGRAPHLVAGETRGVRDGDVRFEGAEAKPGTGASSSVVTVTVTSEELSGQSVRVPKKPARKREIPANFVIIIAWLLSVS